VRCHSPCWFSYFVMTQATAPGATEPFAVGGLKVQDTWSTTTVAGCSTVSTADVKATSSMRSVHCGFGHPGAPGMVSGAEVVRTLNDTLPFLISSSGITWVPVSVIGAGFCPGGWFAP